MSTLRVRWRNFHGFDDTGDLEIRPVTVILGANNCGKSSTFLPLLLLKQTLDEDHSLPVLSTRGDTVSAGSYRDLVLHGDESLDVRFTIEFPHRAPPEDEALCESPFHYPPASVELRFSHDVHTRLPQLVEFTVKNEAGVRMFTRKRRPSGAYSVEGMHFNDGALDNDFDRHLRRGFKHDSPRGFLFTSVPVVMKASRESAHEEKREASQSVSDYWRTLDHVMWLAVRYFQSIRYLGPLREPPHRLYEITSSRPSGVGQRGEFSAEVLRSILDDSEAMGDVRFWLERFRFDEQLSVEEFASGAFSVFMTPEDSDHSINYADMGFGLSQVLPLILAAITTESGETLICEQPEIHLNPGLQSVLANLFVDVASRGGSSIIETHSEHLLLRLRRLVAEGDISADDVAIYYVERDGDASSIRSVPVESNGHINEAAWPAGFFGDALEESIELALAQASDSF